MMPQRLTYLIGRHTQQTISPSERRELMQLLDELGEAAPSDELVGLLSDVQPAETPELPHERILQAVFALDKPARPARVRAIWRWAAAAVLLLGAATALWTIGRQPQTAQPLQADVAPGGNRATLTLGDGTQILLDDASNGNIASQNGVQITKLANGQISYDTRGKPGGDVMWNTLMTPKGGQYTITLPDGSKAWLNASSSITYPTAFKGNKRTVKVTGEVYFEIAKNESQPFNADIPGRTSIDVLGTSFNVNAHADEPAVRTTLLEGSVKVNNVLLKPGQQAVSENIGQSPVILQNVNLEQVIAWKNGVFDFNGADLKTVMRQLERWYDIRVHYQQPTDDIIFKGKMYRNVNLSDVLEMLRKMDVKFELKGRDLTIL